MTDMRIQSEQLNFDGKSLVFKVSGAAGGDYAGTLTLSADGKKLKGVAKYEGFKIRMELEKQK